MEIVEVIEKVDIKSFLVLTIGFSIIGLITVVDLWYIKRNIYDGKAKQAKTEKWISLITILVIVIIVIVFIVHQYVSTSGYKDEYMKVQGEGTVETTTTKDSGIFIKENEVIVHIKTKDNKNLKIALDDVERKVYNLGGYMSKGDKVFIDSDKEYQLKRGYQEKDDIYRLTEGSLLMEDK